MKILLIILAYFTMLIFEACSDNNSSNLPVNSASLIPAKIGNYWIYIDSSYINNKIVYDTVMGRITFSRIANINGKNINIYTQSEFNNSGDLLRSIFLSNESDGLYVFGSDKDTNNLIYSGMIAKYPAVSGNQWTCNYYVYDYQNNLFMTYISHAVCINPNDTFTTPLGKFNCISYKFNTELGETIEYYAPGIGYLGFYNINKGEFAGKRMLIKYQLK